MKRVLVVGGGTSGSVIAARLARSGRFSVTVLEAGVWDPAQQPLASGASAWDPAQQPLASERQDLGAPAPPPGANLMDADKLLGAASWHPANFGYEMELTPGVTKRAGRGIGLGGSSAINGGAFQRARRSDFEGWARLGGSAWSYESALPVLSALERDHDYGAVRGHGDSGPMPVRRFALGAAPLTAAFISAAKECDYPAEPDKNAPDSRPGVGPIPINLRAGHRVSTAEAYRLREAAVAGLLRIVVGARARRIVFDRGQATGVEYEAGGTVRFMGCDELVLCAGAFETPALLLRSGIGPRGDLLARGIEPVADLPVGLSFVDHPQLAIKWSRRDNTSGEQSAGLPAFPAALHLDSSGARGEHPYADLQVLAQAYPIGQLVSGTPGARPWPGAELMQLTVSLLTPRSRGRLTLADPAVRLRPGSLNIRQNYLRDVDDFARLRVGVRTAATLLRSDAFTAIFDDFAELDGATLESDSALDDWMLEHIDSAIHSCATAPLGSVADGAGRVLRVTSLRIADTSLLPSAPSRGPFNTAVFVGELIAREILAESD